MEAPPLLKENRVYEVKRETLAKRKVNWWLRIASFGWDKPEGTIELREKTRQSALIAWILLGIFVSLIIFIPTGFTYRPAMITIIITAFAVLIVTWLNRVGLVNLAGTVLVVSACAATLGVVIASPDGTIHLYYLPAYDFLAIPVILGASILPRISAFIIAVVNIFAIYADLLIQPKAVDMLTAINTYSLPAVTARPVALLVITAVISYAWVRGIEEAIRRADLAEERRTIEQHYAQVESERAARVEEFVQQSIEAIGALANGQEGLLQLPPHHPWQQQATFINTQLKQFYKLKQAHRGNNEQILFAAETLLRLLQRINSGQVAVSALDPRQFITHVTIMDEIAKQLYFIMHRKHTFPSTIVRPQYNPHNLPKEN